MTSVASPAAVPIGGNQTSPVAQPASMLNRHGLITGATGTGKTITLQVLAEGLSRLGIPVFAADVKGDLCGLANQGVPAPRLQARLQTLGLADFCFDAFPVTLWDLYGRTGIPVRMTIAEMGPLLLARLLGLNDTQTGVLYATFKIADDEGLLLLDLADLRAMLAWVGEHAADLKLHYGNLSTPSIAAIQRALLVLEEQGADQVFGEPALELPDLMRRADDGRGVINLLDATMLIQKAPQLYACFLVWLLSELFEELPECGDRDLPVFALFFDEAHLLFRDAPKVLVDKIEQVVRLIRSKGVGVFFVTQSPLDIPDPILGQLGLKVQHALRAFTPREQKTVRQVAGAFRPNPALDTERVITELGIGEALVSTLDITGQPTPVQRVLIRPPASQIGPVEDERRATLLRASPLLARYRSAIDRESAREALGARAVRRPTATRNVADDNTDAPAARAPSPRASSRQGLGEAMAKSMARAVASQIGNQLGRQIVRGILGSLFGGRR